MDPLTHTLVGMNLAATRLGEKTRMATAALVVGANLPDVDAILYFTGHDDLARGFRRGWTHGVLAIAVWPFVLTGLLMLWSRWRGAAEGSGPPLRRGWLLGLSALGILTHPTLDWLNNYGMRWLMPFRGTWFYGDSVFIMDPWLWLILGGGWLASRPPSRRLFGWFVICAAALAYVVGRRQPEYLIVVGVVALVLLGALAMKPRRSLSTLAVILAFAYIGARLTIHAFTAREVRARIAGVEKLMVAPHPIDPTRWDVVAEVGDVYRYGRYTWRDRALRLNDHQIPVAKESPEWAEARRDPSIRGFVTWMRFPWYEVERRGGETRVFVRDARYAVRRRAGRGFGGVEVVIANDPRHRSRE